MFQPDPSETKGHQGPVHLRAQARLEPAHHRGGGLSDDRVRGFLRGGRAAGEVCWNVPDRTRSLVPRSASATHRAAAVSKNRQRNLRTSSLRVFSPLNRLISSSSMAPPQFSVGSPHAL